jgi:hypothetical protein
MKILKLLNKKNLSIIFLFLFSSVESFAEEKPVDIWNIDAKEIEKKKSYQQILMLMKKIKY